MRWTGRPARLPRFRACIAGALRVERRTTPSRPLYHSELAPTYARRSPRDARMAAVRYSGTCCTLAQTRPPVVKGRATPNPPCAPILSIPELHQSRFRQPPPRPPPQPRFLPSANAKTAKPTPLSPELFEMLANTRKTLLPPLLSGLRDISTTTSGCEGFSSCDFVSFVDRRPWIDHRWPEIPI